MQLPGRCLLVFCALSSFVACGDDAVGGLSDTHAEVVDGAETTIDAGEVADDSASVDSVADAPPADTGMPADTAPSDTTQPADAAPEVEPSDVVTPEDTAVGDMSPSCIETCAAIRPLVLVHGINGSPANFDVMAARLIADGWPADWVVRFEADDPSWGCNVDNAAAIAELVEKTRQATCQPRVDLVAHSMGTLSSRYYVKNLGGTERVNTYVTLGGMHHGLFTPCLAPGFLGVCVWQELCQSGDYITQLNADPATPGELHWVSIYGTADETVSNESSHLEGAENIVIEGAEHDGDNGLLQRPDAYAEVLRVLRYPCW